MPRSGAPRTMAGMTTTRFRVPKLQVSDVAHLEKAIEAVPHVNTVTVNATANEVTVEHERADIGSLKSAVQGVGYVAVEEHAQP